MDSLDEIKRPKLPYRDSKLVYMNGPDSEDSNLENSVSNDGTTSVVPLPASLLFIVSVCTHENLLIGYDDFRCMWNWKSPSQTHK
jgi:hypothetical protein